MSAASGRATVTQGGHLQVRRCRGPRQPCTSSPSSRRSAEEPRVVAVHDRDAAVRGAAGRFCTCVRKRVARGGSGATPPDARTVALLGDRYSSPTTRFVPADEARRRRRVGSMQPRRDRRIRRGGGGGPSRPGHLLAAAAEAAPGWSVRYGGLEGVAQLTSALHEHLAQLTQSNAALRGGGAPPGHAPQGLTC